MTLDKDFVSTAEQEAEPLLATYTQPSRIRREWHDQITQSHLHPKVRTIDLEADEADDEDTQIEDTSDSLSSTSSATTFDAPIPLDIVSGYDSNAGTKAMRNYRKGTHNNNRSTMGQE